jgi:hypothetical protein
VVEVEGIDNGFDEVNPNASPLHQLRVRATDEKRKRLMQGDRKFP